MLRWVMLARLLRGLADRLDPPPTTVAPTGPTLTDADLAAFTAVVSEILVALCERYGRDTIAAMTTDELLVAEHYMRLERARRVLELGAIEAQPHPTKETPR